MAKGTWSKVDWADYNTTRGYTSKSTVKDLYVSTKLLDKFNPLNISVRESCDSKEYPNSTPIILGVDVTGSMGRVLEIVAKRLNELITEIYNRKTIVDPHIMIMAIGDASCDDAPLQVSQFEADIKIAKDLNDIYFEKHGGGNDGESYPLAWYFASKHTKIDSFEKRGKKGFIFTMGDEKYLDNLYATEIKKFIGDDIQETKLSAQRLLIEVTRQYEIYHLMIEEGSGMHGSEKDKVIDKWTNLIGQRAIRVSDCTKIPEIIVSILEIAAGKDVDDVVKSWDGSTSIAVHSAIKDLSTIDSSKELIEF